MRRPAAGRFPRAWPSASALAAAALASGACGIAASPDARWTAACPRDASRDGSGRCACAAGDYPLLGACVPAGVGDAFCGPAAVMGRDGCAFRSCGSDEVVDVASGSCVAWAALGRHGAAPCAVGSAPVVESGRIACVAPDATCPRGTRRDGATCARGPVCPPGALPDEGGCRPVIASDGAGGPARVDVGAWTALAVGVDGGPGRPELCAPLTQQPASFGLEPRESATLNIRIALSIPDEDVSRVHASSVDADLAGAPLAPRGQALLARAVDTLVEALRSLGGVSSAGVAEVRVRCRLTP